MIVVFFPPQNGESKADILRTQLALALNNSEENVDVFTILHSPVSGNTSQLDVRFSAHGSPYYYPERINSAVTNHQDEVRTCQMLSIIVIDFNKFSFITRINYRFVRFNFMRLFLLDGTSTRFEDATNKRERVSDGKIILRIFMHKRIEKIKRFGPCLYEYDVVYWYKRLRAPNV